MVCAGGLHLGWFHFHVHWRVAGDTVACEAQEEVACNPPGCIEGQSTPHQDKRCSLVFLDVRGMGPGCVRDLQGDVGSHQHFHFVL